MNLSEREPARISFFCRDDRAGGGRADSALNRATMCVCVWVDFKKSARHTNRIGSERENHQNERETGTDAFCSKRWNKVKDLNFNSFSQVRWILMYEGKRQAPWQWPIEEISMERERWTSILYFAKVSFSLSHHHLSTFKVFPHILLHLPYTPHTSCTLLSYITYMWMKCSAWMRKTFGRN